MNFWLLCLAFLHFTLCLASAKCSQYSECEKLDRCLRGYRKVLSRRGVLIACVKFDSGEAVSKCSRRARISRPCSRTCPSGFVFAGPHLRCAQQRLRRRLTSHPPEEAPQDPPSSARPPIDWSRLDIDEGVEEELHHSTFPRPVLVDHASHPTSKTRAVSSPAPKTHQAPRTQTTSPSPATLAVLIQQEPFTAAPATTPAEEVVEVFTGAAATQGWEEVRLEEAARAPKPPPAAPGRVIVVEETPARKVSRESIELVEEAQMTRTTQGLQLFQLFQATTAVPESEEEIRLEMSSVDQATASSSNSTVLLQVQEDASAEKSSSMETVVLTSQVLPWKSEGKPRSAEVAVEAEAEPKDQLQSVLLTEQRSEASPSPPSPQLVSVVETGGSGRPPDQTVELETYQEEPRRGKVWPAAEAWVVEQGGGYHAPYGVLEEEEPWLHFYPLPRANYPPHPMPPLMLLLPPHPLLPRRPFQSPWPSPVPEQWTQPARPPLPAAPRHFPSTPDRQPVPPLSSYLHRRTAPLPSDWRREASQRVKPKPCLCDLWRSLFSEEDLAPSLADFLAHTDPTLLRHRERRPARHRERRPAQQGPPLPSLRWFLRRKKPGLELFLRRLAAPPVPRPPPPSLRLFVERSVRSLRRFLRRRIAAPLGNFLATRPAPSLRPYLGQLPSLAAFLGRRRREVPLERFLRRRDSPSLRLHLRSRWPRLSDFLQHRPPPPLRIWPQQLGLLRTRWPRLSAFLQHRPPPPLRIRPQQLGLLRTRWPRLSAFLQRKSPPPLRPPHSSGLLWTVPRTTAPASPTGLPPPLELFIRFRRFPPLARHLHAHLPRLSAFLRSLQPPPLVPTPPSLVHFFPAPGVPPTPPSLLESLSESILLSKASLSRHVASPSLRLFLTRHAEQGRLGSPLPLEETLEESVQLSRIHRHGLARAHHSGRRTGLWSWLRRRRGSCLSNFRPWQRRRLHMEESETVSETLHLFSPSLRRWLSRGSAH